MVLAAEVDLFTTQQIEAGPLIIKAFVATEPITILRIMQDVHGKQYYVAIDIFICFRLASRRRLLFPGWSSNASDRVSKKGKKSYEKSFRYFHRETFKTKQKSF